VALPASICSLTCAVTFFGGAILVPLEPAISSWLLAVSWLMQHLDFGAQQSAFAFNRPRQVSKPARS
jgi:hypothetical protein